MDAALAYAERHGLHALLVERDGTLVLEQYADGWSAERPHPLYSGTKSFWGIACVAAQEDGRIELDAPVADVLGDWRSDPEKAGVTLRQLLQLTSGHGFGGLGAAVPIAPRALALPLKNPPGERFTYGGIPLQIAGEVLRRALGREPHAYLRERILAPLGIGEVPWRELPDGTQPLPTGAAMRAPDWLRYGRFLLARGAGPDGTRIVSDAGFTACTTGSAANPAYGLGLWLGGTREGTPYVYASGAGGQGLYMVPDRRLVAVHFGKSTSWKHDAFVRALV